MQLSGVQFFIASLLLVGVNAAARDGGIPGDLLAIVAPDTLLKPLLNTSPSSKKIERRESVLRGLLEVRQSSCPIGWSGCSSGGCCPIGGQCCPNDKCCDTGNHCCQGGGCCELGDNCVTITSTGERGCCPIGRTCVGNDQNPCVTPSYSPCPNDNFCCPPGDICYRDSVGDRQCRSPGSTPPPTTRPVTTFTSSSTRSLTPTSVGTATGNVPTVYPTPVPLSGTQNVIIHSSDTRITWVGSSWHVKTSSCNATDTSKETSSSGHSFTLSVTSVTSIYISLWARNVEYDITINGRTTTYTETTSLHNCQLSWSSGVLTTGTGLVTVNVRGPATTLSGTNPNDWSFEFSNFLVTMSDQSAATSSGSLPTSNPPGTTPFASMAKAFSAHSVVTACLTAAFVVLFNLL